MRIINGQIYFKILFFGTALAGKTTVLNWIYDNIIPKGMKSTLNVRSVNTSFGQTMLFDFVPVQVSENIHIRFFTATGQDYYASTRKMLFQDVDGVFLVIDSQKKELKHNKEFMVEFYHHVEKFFKRIDDIIVTVLCNKQDVKNKYTSKYLIKTLELENFQSYDTCAISGDNLKEAFSYMVQACLQKIKQINL